MASIRTAESIGTISKSSSTTISLAASRINIAGQQYINASALSASVSTTGAGGLDTGAVAANTLYAIYAVVSNGASALVASTNLSSPSGFSASRLIGYFNTNNSSQVFSVHTDRTRLETTIWVYGGATNGTGSTNTNCRIFTTVDTIGGHAVTYSTSATLGDSFTINESGVYAIEYGDSAGVGTWYPIISRNSSSLNATTGIENFSISGLRVTLSSELGAAEATTRLVAGDVIRAQALNSSTKSAVANKSVQFRITKIPG